MVALLGVSYYHTKKIDVESLKDYLPKNMILVESILQSKQTLRLNEIEPNREQPRRDFNDESISALADSIKEHGLLQPIVVRPIDGGYQIVAGERRWRACRMIGLSEVPVVIKDFTDFETAQVALIENLQRENLNPIEEARGLKRLADEFSLTHETIAKAVGKSRSAISNSLRLLALPEPVQEMLYARRLEMGHARALLTLPVVTQLELAQKAVKNGWSVREVERRSQMAQQGKPAEAPKRDNPDIRRLSEALTETLGVNAEVHSSNQKKGRIVLHFDSPETLEALLKQLGVDLPN